MNPTVKAKQYTGYKKAYSRSTNHFGGITFNDGYNVDAFGITSAVYYLIQKLLEETTGSGKPSLKLHELNAYLAGDKVCLSRAHPDLVARAREVL